MRKVRRGLRLSKETLRRLSIGRDELARIAGGGRGGEGTVFSTTCSAPGADFTIYCDSDTTAQSLTGSRKC